MVILEDVVQLLDFFGSDGFDDESAIVGHPKLRVGPARRVGRDRLRLAYGIQILAVLHAEPLAQVAEHQRTILLHFEMTRHVLSKKLGDVREDTKRERGGDKEITIDAFAPEKTTSVTRE